MDDEGSRVRECKTGRFIDVQQTENCIMLPEISCVIGTVRAGCDEEPSIKYDDAWSEMCTKGIRHVCGLQYIETSIERPQDGCQQTSRLRAHFQSTIDKWVSCNRYYILIPLHHHAVSSTAIHMQCTTKKGGNPKIRRPCIARSITIKINKNNPSASEAQLRAPMRKR